MTDDTIDIADHLNAVSAACEALADAVRGDMSGAAPGIELLSVQYLRDVSILLGRLEPTCPSICDDIGTCATCVTTGIEQPECMFYRGWTKDAKTASSR